MALQDIQIDTPGKSRGEVVKKITQAQDTWREAQAKMSACRMHVADADMKGSNYRLFCRTHKIEFQDRSFGIDDVRASERDYTKRALFVKPYDHALQIDLTDLWDNDTDIFADDAAEVQSAMARLTDRIILNSIIGVTFEHQKLTASPLEQDRVSGRTSTKDRQLTGSTNIAAIARENVFARVDAQTKDNVRTVTTKTASKEFKTTWGTTTKIKTFESTDSVPVADTLTEFTNGLLQKDIAETVYMTLTPALRQTLMKDKTYQNLENLYAGKTTTINASFMYNNVMLIGTSNSVLPELNVLNVATAAPTAGKAKVNFRPLSQLGQAAPLDAQSTATSKFHYTATNGTHKAIADRLKDTEIGGEKTTASNLASITDAEKTTAAEAANTGYAIGQAEVAKTDLVYFWTKPAIKYAAPDFLRVSERSTLPLLRHAVQQYDMVAAGAVCVDDNFAGALILDSAKIVA